MGTRREQRGVECDWIAPTEVERALAEAKSRADWDGYLSVLTGAEVFLYVFKKDLDKHTAQPRLRRDRDGGWCVHVYTRGALLREPREQLVAVRLDRPERLWKRWKLSDSAYTGLLVNPGTPTEAFFPGRRSLARRWRTLARARGVSAPRREENVLLTRRTGVLEGPLAHGLACGAHLAVANAVFWNDVGDVYVDHPTEVELLRDLWDVTDHESWRRELTALLEGRNSPPQPEFVLAVREVVEERYGKPVTAGQWRETAVQSLLDAADDTPGEEEYEAAMAVVTAVTGQILRYEARFRADGLLPPSGRVRSALAYDYGRAVNLARWGRGARYATTPQAEEAVLRAGELCRATYTSWAELSAGYVLGRALRFDQESFGDWYTSALTPHRILTSDPESPWRTLSFTLTEGPG
ncbi:DUF1266 domain-containing protein [Streptomyces iconiensis]|uniref:DUF1266 domain-containing protein n=1 Tax=Streptomyces iconiensis TaxID=1384038 RepID=A0ABT6ZTU5_9ACTN|nr:DUF1266 domain-containing protein [Streptomyces iconiensis]MDJ1132485.1 DUF1266 domain-containing protein [Streptomyces iconiensis]